MIKAEEKLKSNPMEAAMLFVVPAIIIAGFELLLEASIYKPNMNLYDLTGKLDSNYSLIMLLLYVIVLVSLFPLTLCLFKKNGLELKHKFFRRGEKSKDILFGITAGLSSYAFGIIINHVILKFPIYKYENVHQLPIAIISLVIVSGLLKEIYFRGIPYIFLKDAFGEWTAFLMGNICFTILDWPNVGYSFFLGLIWYLFYRKRGSLSIPVIAHGLHNLLYMLAGLGAFSFIGIIPK
jgi:CAAX amino terminal protease family.